jgi:hypothetical protein
MSAGRFILSKSLIISCCSACLEAGSYFVLSCSIEVNGAQYSPWKLPICNTHLSFWARMILRSQMVGTKMTIANDTFTIYSNRHFVTILNIAAPHGSVKTSDVKLR